MLEQRLAGRDWIMGDDYTIADMATFPWVRNLVGFYEAGELVEIDEFANVTRVLAAFLARPAVVRGLEYPAGLDTRALTPALSQRERGQDLSLCKRAQDASRRPLELQLQFGLQPNARALGRLRAPVSDCTLRITPNLGVKL